MSGSGDITFNLTIGVNGKEERSGEVVIQTESIPFRVKIKQASLELEFHPNDIYSTESNPENPDIDIVTGYIDYESSVVINDITFTIEYLDGDGWINSITNRPDSD